MTIHGGGAKGVYKRGRYWYYKVGKICRSTGSEDIEEAIAQRDIARAVLCRRVCSEEWRHWVAAQRTNSNGWLRRTHSHMRRKSRKKKWEQCMALEEFSRIVTACNGECALTGLPLDTVSKRHPFSISADRIDSSKGYVLGNVRIVALAVNLAMSHWGEEAVLQIARALVGRELTNAFHAKKNGLNGSEVGTNVGTPQTGAKHSVSV